MVTPLDRPLPVREMITYCKLKLYRILNVYSIFIVIVLKERQDVYLLAVKIPARKNRARKILWRVKQRLLDDFTKKKERMSSRKTSIPTVT